MKRICALAAVGIGCASAGVSFASDGSGHGLKPRALAFMRSVTIPETGAPPAVRNVFAQHPLAQPVEVGLEVLALLEDGRAWHVEDAADDHPSRLARRVQVDCRDHAGQAHQGLALLNP